ARTVVVIRDDVGQVAFRLVCCAPREPQRRAALMSTAIQSSRPVAPLLWRACALGFAATALVLASFAMHWRPSAALEREFVLLAWLDQSLLVTAPLVACGGLPTLLERVLRWW